MGRRIEDVLGTGWERHVEGHKLKVEGDAFADKLNTDEFFERWLRDAREKLTFNTTLPIFKAEEEGSDKHIELQVNFNLHILDLFKEVRNLQSLRLRFPYNVTVISSDARVNFPYVMAMQEAIDKFMATVKMVPEKIAPLVAGS